MENGLAQYGAYIRHIKELIYKHQYEAMKQVNTGLLQLYWEIGEEICHRQREQGWGKSVVEILSKELQKEFPGVSGYSTTNLWRMRNFYVEYSQEAYLPPSVGELQKLNLPPSAGENSRSSGPSILQPMGAEIGGIVKRTVMPPLVAEISWTKNYVIIEKCKDPLEREFYIRVTKKFGWTKDVLINNIENQAYERYLSNQTNFDDTVPEKYRLQAKLAVKDEYNFGFLEMGLQHSETELEHALISKVRSFLIEMGGYYTFVGNRFHLDLAGDDYYIDILLFHRQLRCLIAIDLKIGEFIPEYAGKMQFYLAALDDKVRLPDENPSIGIIVCKSKKRMRVEYALKVSTAPIGVATYTFHSELPEDMRKLLPSPDEIAEIVRGIGGDDDDEA